MHKLERPQAPACLAKYKHGQNNWGDVSSEEKLQIWQRLDEMQQKRCAYCESQINKDSENKDAHIEHFRQRSRCPQETFKWSNLFGSCNRQDSCGNHKDRLPPYDPADLIKMDEENPDDYFLFVADGTIALRKNLTERQKHRAEESLRVFNLNPQHGALRYMRKATVQGYLQTAEELVEMALKFDAEEWLPLLEEELNATKDLPFATAIRHIMMPF
ncbi:MAG: TIGR02646 family protein [Desulfobacteraceae bacterium]|nr:TIGR02646 family protein [Desulfobacteraceae bacterium]